MDLTPHDWSVVVVGFWNRAIYTPHGIAHRLLQAGGEEVSIEIPFDTIAPFRVGYGEHVVVVEGGRLMVELQNPTLDCLGDAMTIAVRAMEDLPKTPVKAAGINIRHSAKAPSQEGLASVRESLRHIWDKSLQNSGFSVSHRMVSRKFGWREGITLLSVNEEDDKLDVHMNFEKSGEVNELIDWLRMPTDEIREHVNQIYGNILNLEAPLT